MPDRVRVGVVGTSWFADLAHLPSLSSHPGAELAAICGRDGGRARAMADKYGFARTYTDYREMFQSGELDAAVIVTPDDTHHAMAMAAIGAGLHVLCEKPMASGSAQAREMYEAAEARGIRHMMYFTYRWLPGYRRLAEMVRGGHIGQPYLFQASYTADFARGLGYAWRLDRARANGVLGDLGSHLIDLARWCMGEVVAVSARLHASVPHPGADGLPNPANDSADLLLDFANGARGNLHIDALTLAPGRGQQQRVQISGPGGTLTSEIGLEAGHRLLAARAGDPAIADLSVAATAREQLDTALRTESAGDRLLIDAILGDFAPSPSFEDGLRVQEVIDAALRSDREGRRIELPDHGS